MGGFDLRCRFCRREIREGGGLGVRRRVGSPSTTSASGGHARDDGAREHLALRREDEAWRQRREDMAQLAEIGGHQRIGDRDGRVGDADMHGGEPKKRMLDANCRRGSRPGARPKGRAREAPRRCAARAPSPPHKRADANRRRRRVAPGRDARGASRAQCARRSVRRSG